MSTDRILESARRVAELWKDADAGRDALTETYGSMVPALDELVGRCSEPMIHRTEARTITTPGRAEDGYQPEREYVWSCSCAPGWKSEDQGGSAWAKQAADKHRNDPERFPAGPR